MLEQPCERRPRAKQRRHVEAEPSEFSSKSSWPCGEKSSFSFPAPFTAALDDCFSACARFFLPVVRKRQSVFTRTNRSSPLCDMSPAFVRPSSTVRQVGSARPVSRDASRDASSSPARIASSSRCNRSNASFIGSFVSLMPEPVLDTGPSSNGCAGELPA